MLRPNPATVSKAFTDGSQRLGGSGAPENALQTPTEGLPGPGQHIPTQAASAPSTIDATSQAAATTTFRAPWLLWFC